VDKASQLVVCALSESQISQGRINLIPSSVKRKYLQRSFQHRAISFLSAVEIHMIALLVNELEEIV
jgi:hypothetical protein